MSEEEGAALGAALQAAWCVARRDGQKTSIVNLAKRVVRLDETTRCLPDRKHVQRYRELQALQDQLGGTLREIFPAQRKLAGG